MNDKSGIEFIFDTGFFVGGSFRYEICSNSSKFKIGHTNYYPE